MASPEEKKEEETKIGAQCALGKITQAGYSSLDVSYSFFGVERRLYGFVHAVDTVLYLWTGRGACLDDKERDKGTAGRRGYPVRASFLSCAVVC
jgi:hypothetical protein